MLVEWSLFVINNQDLVVRNYLSPYYKQTTSKIEPMSMLELFFIEANSCLTPLTY